MKRLILIITAVILLCPDLDAQKVRFMPQWTAQAQFAGFYVAQEKGFYKEEGLDVVIEHIGSTSSKSIMDHLVEGDVDIAVQQLLPAIITRSDNRKIVNVMQLQQVSGLCCVSRAPISRPEDLMSLSIGRWATVYNEFADVLEILKGINANWITALSPVNLFLFKAVDAALCESYNELNQILMAEGDIPQSHILRFAEHGFDCPEDGLYVTERYYKKHRDTVEKFVRASKKGWEYSREHQEEALEISQKYIKSNHIITNNVIQKLMLEECLRLQINPVTKIADFAPVSEEVFNSLNEVLFNTGYITRMLDYSELIK